MCFMQVLDALEKIFTILAIGAGGAWTYFHYLRRRTYRRRLQPELSGGLTRRGGVEYLLATVRVKNLGLTKVDIQQRGSALRVFSYNAPADVQKARNVACKRLATFAVFEQHQWIESGETIEDQRLIAIPSNGGVAFRLELRLVANEITWTAVNIIQWSADSQPECPGSPTEREGLAMDPKENISKEQKAEGADLTKDTEQQKPIQKQAHEDLELSLQIEREKQEQAQEES